MLASQRRRKGQAPDTATTKPRSIRLLLRIVFLVVVTSGCSLEQDRPRDLPIFTSSLVRDIDLEADGGPVVMGVDYLAVDSTGHLFVLDGRLGNLHKYDASGRYRASLSDAEGRSLFLRQPSGAWPGGIAIGRDDNIYLTGAPHDMFPNQFPDTSVVAKISPDFLVRDVFRVERIESLKGPYVWEDNLVIVLNRPRDSVERLLGYSETHVNVNEELLIMTYAGTEKMYFRPVDERKHDVPYWGGWLSTFLAPTGKHLLAVNALYPIHQYDSEGLLTDTFGSASPSFRQPSRPAPGSFLTADARYYEWRNSFTTIDGIHVLADSLVVVVLVDQNGDMHAAIERCYRADVFNLNSGEVVARDVALEGKVLHADTLLYVAWRPTAEGWHIGLFDLMEEGSR